MGKIASYIFIGTLIILLSAKVTSRSLPYSCSSDDDDEEDGISDGIDRHFQSNKSSVLLLKRVEEEEDDYCEQMYGFLPCSYSPLGDLFLILVYEYLLFHGESYVSSGGERIFKIVGPGIFGASVFHLLGPMPEAFILLASGLLNSKETAQEYAYTGVGLLAGSTILLLTAIWGTCVIVASRDFSANDSNPKPKPKPKPKPSASSDPRHNQFWRLLSFFTGYGVTTDLKTSYTATIMLLSAIPLITIQIPKVFHLSAAGERIVIAITLIVSLLFLLSYFFYQTFQPWIQTRRLEFVKHENLVVDILARVQKYTVGRLLTEDGAPNVEAIKMLFEDVDQNSDNLISFSELRKLLSEIKYRRWDVDRDIVVNKVMKEFDPDGDKKITEVEFINGITKWLDETKQAMDKQPHSAKSFKHLYQILQPWILKKREEHETRNQLISEILEHVQSSARGSLLTEDGKPDIQAIKRLFESIDTDKDNCISQSELKELVVGIQFRNLPLDADEAVEKIMEELDLSGDQMINEEEFVTGFSKWLNPVNSQTPRSVESLDEIHQEKLEETDVLIENRPNQTPNSAESQDETYQKKWEEADMLVEERNVDKSLWAWMKAIMLLVLGIAMLAVLAEPLIESVQNLSESANIPSFFISFILVPLATNARGAISAIKAASKKKPRTTSLTFSEIYGSVFMNNILGFSVLLSLIYFRGLSWDFAAEVFILLIVSTIMGVATSFSRKFPVWTSLLAFLLYPSSLILVFLLNDYFR